LPAVIADDKAGGLFLDGQVEGNGAESARGRTFVIAVTDPLSSDR
jgi:hypothetical protein